MLSPIFFVTQCFNCLTQLGLRSFGSSVSPVYTFVVREKPWMPWRTRKWLGASFASFVERGAEIGNRYVAKAQKMGNMGPVLEDRIKNK